jgi:predicted dehydrogenase
MTPDLPASRPIVGRDRWSEADYRPRFPPGSRYGIGVLGAGTIAQSAHLPAYEKYGLEVVGVWSRRPETTATVRDRFPSVGRVYDSADDLLDDPAVRVVDLAMGPLDRGHWLGRVVRAGKHVLSQKPLTTDPDSLLPVLAEADATGVRIAVNQNGRWAPPWRLATLMVQGGAVGQVLGVTHLHDKPLPPITGTPFDEIPHMLVTDYLVHWLDITRCWLEGHRATAVRARDHRTPGQPPAARNPWAATVEIDTGAGAGAMVRVVGDVRTTTPSCPFWVHGSAGTLRGSLLGKDFLELDEGDGPRRFPLEGAWFVDGFAGAMGELMCAVEEDRDPYNSARHNLATLRLLDAASRSAEQDGASVTIDEPL